MRKILIAVPVLLLSGCINDSATYYADSTQEHTLTVRRQQDYFWSETARYTLMVSRLPDCQRQTALAEMALEDTELELFSTGERQWNVRAGKRVWQVETQGCTVQGPGGAAQGTRVGIYRSDGDKMVFEAEEPAAADAGVEPAPLTEAPAAEGAAAR